MAKDEMPALMSGILADPEEDAPRLVFADWLEDHDEPSRAQHIRAQCRAARLAVGTPGRASLVAEAKRLEKKHLSEWLGPLDPESIGDPLTGSRFKRGLLAGWWSTVAAFLAKKQQRDASD